VTKEAAREVARRSRGTPREAIQLLERARDIAQVSAMTQASAASQISAMSQVDVGAGPKLAHVGQMHSLSPDVTRAQNSQVAKTSKTDGATYGNDDAGSRDEGAGELDSEDASSRPGEAHPPEQCSRGAVPPSQGTQDPALASGREPAPASGAAASSSVPQDAPQASPMTQVMANEEAKLAHVGQMHSLSTDATTCQIWDLTKTGKTNPWTYENSEAAPRVDPPASSGAREVHVVHGAHVREAARRAGIDKHGLSREERQIVRLLLRRRKPMGLEAIASRLGLDLETLRDVHEPWLERAGLVERTVRGRVATQRAQAWYGRPKSKKPRGPSGNEDGGEGQDGGKGQAGPNGGRRSIPILRLPFRFG
jgi:hypothetical protein